MKYGSLQNLMLSKANAATVNVGDGATTISYTDRAPATVIFVSENGKEIHIQKDHFERIDNNGMSDCQEYKYSPNPDGAVWVCRVNRRGKWERCVKSEKTKRYSFSGEIIAVGVREKYHDFSF